ncbi:MAG: EAL domain-containing protein, partial [Solirubrobacteraceae bacterium]
SSLSKSIATTAQAAGRDRLTLCSCGEQEREPQLLLPDRVAATEPIDHLEARYHRKDGGAIEMPLSPSPPKLDADEEGVATIGLARAMSERTEQALVEAQERLRGVFEEAQIGMVILSRGLLIRHANAAMSRLLGRDAKELVGRCILDFTHPEDAQPSRDWTKARLAAADAAPLLKRYLRPDGSIIQAQVTTTLITPPGSEPYLISNCQDVTEQRRAERQKAVIADLAKRALECRDVIDLMHEAVSSVRAILETTLCIVARHSSAGDVRLIAADGESISWTIGPGHPTQTAYSLKISRPVMSNDLLCETRFSAPPSVLARGMRRSLSVPVPERSGARHVILAHGPASMRPLTWEDVRFVEAVANLIAGALDRASSEDELRNELRRQALEDPLTGLANRALLANQLEAELRHAHQLAAQVCVLALDLDRFKAVNDTLGHSAGDALLQEVAERLSKCVRDGDLVARPGGDEFTVICTLTPDDRTITDIAQRLVDAMIEPFLINDREVFVTASVGVSISQHGTQTPEELLRDADTAMYRAKELGGSRFEMFDATLRQRLVHRMAIESELRHAIERQQLELHYQPVVDLADQRIVGFEALLRWRRPNRGIIAPDEFIAVAEETGLIVPIGSWVLDTVCEQLGRWPAEIRISANLSALQITPRLVSEVTRLLQAHSVAPDRLVLEITESLVLDPAIKPVVSQLRALGVLLALDDFGSGYSSLGSLQRFPLDLLKLDRTLIDSLTEPNGAAVVQAAVELGRALGVEVVAEGIETEAQLAILRQVRCPHGQGYLFAKPLPLPDAQSLIMSQPGRSRRSSHTTWNASRSTDTLSRVSEIP